MVEIHIVPQYDRQKASLLFNIWDGVDAVAAVKNHVRPLLGGINWEDY